MINNTEESTTKLLLALQTANYNTLKEEYNKVVAERDKAHRERDEAREQLAAMIQSRDRLDEEVARVAKERDIYYVRFTYYRDTTSNLRLELKDVISKRDEVREQLAKITGKV